MDQQTIQKMKSDLEAYRASKQNAPAVPGTQAAPAIQSTGDIRKDLEAYRASKSAPVVEQQEAPKRDFLQKAGDVVNSIFPGKQVGQAIGTLAGYHLSDNKDQYDLSAPTPLQVAGDVAEGALTIGGLKVPLASKGIARIGQGAGLGGALSGASAISEGEKAKDVVKSAAIGAGVGGGLGLLSEGLNAAVKKVPKTLMQKAVGQKPSQIKKGESVVDYALSKKRVGTAPSMLRTSQKEIDRLNDEISTALQSTGDKTIKASSVVKQLTNSEEAKNALMKAPEVREFIERTVPESKRLLKKETLSIKELNDLRKIVDRTIGDRGWNATTDTFSRTIMKSFANDLRNLVKETSGSHQLFSDLSNEIRFSNALSDKIARGANKQFLSFGDLLGGGIGSVFAPGLGSLAGIGARRAVNDPLVQTGAARAIQGTAKSLKGLRKPTLIGVQKIINEMTEK